jgi:hypothetical protein
VTTHGDPPAARSATPTASAEPEESATPTDSVAPPASPAPPTPHASPAQPLGGPDAPAAEEAEEAEIPADEGDDEQPADTNGRVTTVTRPDESASADAAADEPAGEPAEATDEPDEEPAGATDEPDEEPAAAVEDPAEDPAEEPTEQPAAAADRLAGQLGYALHTLRDAIAQGSYPLALTTADEARRVGAALVAQLDDYLLPRLARLDAPLLVVIGGSTGAGKSTLVNSLVRAPVSAAGVLRPTTRAPVLVCHPNDTSWFRQGDLLPGLTRTAKASTDPHTLQLVAAPALTPGLAFVDAPDIDSVVDANRALAAQLLAAADLWLFVTTAARYADAVPWELLRTARLRGTVTALVLDRVPPEAAEEISDHLRQMLAVHDLDTAPLFVLPEATITGQGLLPDELISPLRGWFERLAADASVRSAIVRQTLDGALAALDPALAGLAAAADEQAGAAKTLAERVGAAHGAALGTVEHGVRDGALLRGEVLARWQEFVGTGELMRTLEARIGRLRDRVAAAITGRPAPGRQLQHALESNLVTLIRGAAADAAEHAYTSWQAHPAGAALLEPELARPSAEFRERAERLVRDWQRAVLDLVREEGGDRRFVARTAAYAVNATGLAVMIAVFASTAFIPTGLEVAAGAGTTVAAQKVLEAIFGDQAIRNLASKAREDLLARVDALLEAEGTRYLRLLESTAIEGEQGARLRAAAEAVERARTDAALTGGASLALPGGIA